MQYSLRKNPRARRINITVRRDGSVWVTKPRRVSMREVERFVEKSARWIERAKARLTKLRRVSRIESSTEEYKKYKAAARTFVARRLEQFNKVYGFTYATISIRNQKSRWGSCSRSGNLSFNYRILFLPDHLADYILVHELCHVRELNHSKRFWDLVALTIPDHRLRRKALRTREYGLLIAP